jgi:hypothetical protein
MRRKSGKMTKKIEILGWSIFLILLGAALFVVIR